MCQKLIGKYFFETISGVHNVICLILFMISVFGCTIFFSEILYRLIVQFPREVLNHGHHHRADMRNYNIFKKVIVFNTLVSITGPMLTVAAIVMSFYDPLFKDTFWSVDVGCVVATYFTARLINLVSKYLWSLTGKQLKKWWISVPQHHRRNVFHSKWKGLGLWERNGA